MKTARLLVLSAIAVVTALPVVAQANSIYHPAPGEQGYTEHWDHFRSTKTRAQVLAEVEMARKDGSLRLMHWELPVPVKSSTPPKTRQQVINEIRTEPPAAREARLALLTGG